MNLADRLSKVKSSINTKEPRSFGILKKKRKVDSITLMKQYEIQRENKHLIEKLTHIMDNPRQCDIPYNYFL
jgi:hypothetical protein